MADICGLYIGGETLSLLSLKSGKKGWIVNTGGVEFHTAGDSDELGPFVKSLCKSLKISSGEVAVVLPKQQAILRNVLLPSIDRDELVQMARFEAERHIPFHAERHSTGFHLMRSMGVEGSEVILGAIDGPVVQRALDAVAAAGLTPRGVNLSSVCLVNSLIFEKRDWIKGKTIAVIAIGLDCLDLALITEGRLIFARSVTMDLRGVLEAWIGFQAGQGAVRPDVTKLALAARLIDCMNLDGHYGQAGGATSKEAPGLVRSWIDRLIQELRRTYDFARREMKCPPIDAVALTGEGSLLRNLNQYLFLNLNVEIQSLNPVGALAGAEAHKLPFEGLEYVIPFGGAVSQELEGAFRLDLTPAGHYRKLARRRTLRQAIATAVLFVITLALSVAAWLRAQDTSAQEIAAYEAFNAKAKPQVAELEIMKAKLEIISNFMNDPNSALKVFNAIAGDRNIPRKITLNGLNYTKGKEIIIEGDAREIPDINNFSQDLRASGHFMDVGQQGDFNREPMYNQFYFAFKLVCPFAIKEKEANNKTGGRNR